MDVLRKVLAAASLLIALIGLMPLVPLTFGFKSAVVTNASAGTFYPTTNPNSTDTPFILCTQDPTPQSMKKRQNFTGNYFRCTNNWGTPVTIAWGLVSGTSGLTVSNSASVPAGAQGVCVSVTFTTPNANSSNVTNVYSGTIDQSDLYAVIQFSGVLTIDNSSTPTACV